MDEHRYQEIRKKVQQFQAHLRETGQTAPIADDIKDDLNESSKHGDFHSFKQFARYVLKNNQC